VHLTCCTVTCDENTLWLFRQYLSSHLLQWGPSHRPQMWSEYCVLICLYLPSDLSVTVCTCMCICFCSGSGGLVYAKNKYIALKLVFVLLHIGSSRPPVNAACHAVAYGGSRHSLSILSNPNTLWVTTYNQWPYVLHKHSGTVTYPKPVQPEMS
jgi:hypothetical protein